MKKNDKGNYKLLNITLLLVMLYLLTFLMSKELYVLAAIYTLLMSVWLIWKISTSIINNIKFLLFESKKVKALKYYYITDDNKRIDLEKRGKMLNVFRDMTMSAYIVLIVNWLSIYYLIKILLKDSVFLDMLFTAIMLFLACVVNIGLIANIIYKYTTLAYVSIPFIGGVAYFLLFATIFSSSSIIVQCVVYLLITIILYVLLVYTCPVHILRKLNGKTALISSLITIATGFFTPILLLYLPRYLGSGDGFLTLEDIRNTTEISYMLKHIILDNPELIEIINYFLANEFANMLNTVMSLIITILTISYVIGGIITNRKIKRHKLKAKLIFRGLIKKEYQMNYENLIKCSFHGGEAYEDLILNNSEASQIIVRNEAGLNISKTSIILHIRNWIEKNSILYLFFVEVKKRI